MPLPQTTIKFVDGGLGIVGNGAGKTQLMVGVSAGGTTGSVVAIGSPTAAKNILVAGPLYDAVYNRTALSGSSVLAVPVAISAAGTIGAWTQQGSGAGAVSSTVANFQQILVKCILGGTLGTATFQFSVNGSAYGATVTSVAGWSSTGYQVIGTMSVLTFGGGGTYRANDVYTIPTTGVCSASVPSGGPTGPSQTSSPVDAYSLQVTIVLAGNLATAQFTYSLDGGNTISAPIVTAATVILPNTGIILGFTSAAYVAGDIYSATATTAAFATTSAQNAILAALTSPYPFEGVEIVGMPLTAANAVSFFSALDTELQAAETTYKTFLYVICSCPCIESDATVTADFASLTSATGRTSVCVGTCDVTSVASGLILRRPISWVYGTRLASTRRSEHPGKVMLGAIPGVIAIQNAQSGTDTADAFDSSRFVTMRTIQGIPGFYLTRGNTMALSTSDYSRIMNVRVVDFAATIAQAGLNFYLNADWRIDPKTGKIDARDANSINAKITQEIASQVIGEPGSASDEASSVEFAIDPTSNLLSTSTLMCTITIVPKGYSETIQATIGLANPRLQT